VLGRLPEAERRGTHTGSRSIGSTDQRIKEGIPDEMASQGGVRAARSDQLDPCGGR